MRLVALGVAGLWLCVGVRTFNPNFCELPTHRKLQLALVVWPAPDSDYSFLNTAGDWKSILSNVTAVKSERYTEIGIVEVGRFAAAQRQQVSNDNNFPESTEETENGESSSEAQSTTPASQLTCFNVGSPLRTISTSDSRLSHPDEKDGSDSTEEATTEHLTTEDEDEGGPVSLDELAAILSSIGGQGVQQEVRGIGTALLNYLITYNSIGFSGGEDVLKVLLLIGGNVQQRYGTSHGGRNPCSETLLPAELGSSVARENIRLGLVLNGDAPPFQWDYENLFRHITVPTAPIVRFGSSKSAANSLRYAVFSALKLIFCTQVNATSV
eukprot:Gregarina_sp_Poly_1__996@NODE_1242_length_4649_cov_191_440637_g847_i0_p2_GENE_NODE_1242_length_4649_cov_191_440637_g847_i0NODE_1242_length_4649_cov_191_440637_g847_i0_p2_ORF_typecomplete_len326_score36_75_NODE_1242_length_4649_cov_191_440637_g847_i019742951